MSGQMSVSSKKKIVEDFVQNNDPYKENEPLKFDLRSYADYVRKNNLSAEQISVQILDKFRVG